MIRTKIYVTRHGQTDWNVLKKAQGRCDIELNQLGIQQAKENKSKLENENIDLIISSPLLRAKQTATIINEGINAPIIYDDRILERDFGEFEGVPTYEFDFNLFWDYYENKTYERAENVQNFFDRIYNFLEDIIKENVDKNILIVGHGGVSIPIYCFFSKEIPRGSLLSVGLKNCEVKIYEVEI